MVTETSTDDDDREVELWKPGKSTTTQTVSSLTSIRVKSKEWPPQAAIAWRQSLASTLAQV